MANATRGGEADGSWRNVHQSTPARARRPSRVNRVKTSRSRMRQIKPTACGGPCRGVPSTRRGRRGCSSVGESRACGHDDDCWVGRCASRHPPRWDTAKGGPSRDRTSRSRCGIDPLMRHEPPQVRARPTSRQHDAVQEQSWTGASPWLLACSSRWTAPRAAGFRCPHDVDNNVDIDGAGPRRCR